MFTPARTFASTESKIFVLAYGTYKRWKFNEKEVENMKTLTPKLFRCFMAVVLSLGLCLPTSAFAQPASSANAQDAPNSAETVYQTEDTPIADWTECGQCKWMIDSAGQLKITATGENAYELSSWEDAAPWCENYASDIKSVNLVTSVQINNTARGMFKGCENLEYLVNFDNLITTNESYPEISMQDMFNGCTKLGEVLLSSFDTSKVTSMQSMFANCETLEEIEFPSKFDTSNVTTMAYMFSGCSSLKTLKGAGKDFDTGNVTSMRSMFANCNALENIDASAFETGNVTLMDSMFSNCAKLTTLDLSTWDLASLKSMDSMFASCSKLKTLKLTGKTTPNLKSMYGAFSGCSALTTLNLGSMTTSAVTEMTQLFNGCSTLTTLDLSSLDTSKVKYMTNMFYGCSALTTVKLGANFTFNGAGATRLCNLPDGNWKNATGTVYAASEVPNNTEDTYTKQPPELDFTKFTVNTDAETYTGSAITKTITADGYALNTDYTVEYSNNTNVGTATITIKGAGSYAGEQTYNFTINPAALDFTQISVDTKNEVYTGQKIKKTITSDVYNEDKDYTVVYNSPSIEVGSVTITITGTGNYTGEQKYSFEIVAQELDFNKFTVDTAAETYSGSAITKTITASDYALNTDYTVEYSNNTDPGTATITIKGTGNYAGEQTYNFTINPAELDFTKFTVDTATETYTGSAITKTITCTDYTASTDYTVTYANNTEVGTAKITIAATENSNYTGSKDYEFTISPAALDFAKFTVDTSSETYTGEAITKTISSDVYKLNSDYTVAYANNTEVGSATITITGAGNYTGEQQFNFDIVSAGEKVQRLSGTSADDTAAAIAKEAYPNGSNWVVIARDDDFADAMSATGLAGALGAPIILTSRNELSAAAKQAMKDLSATQAYIIGGNVALSQNIESGLTAIGVECQGRVWGTEAWDTSVACANKIKEHTGKQQSDVIVAMSTNFQDALSISSFAYKYAVPIFLETDEYNGRTLTNDAKSTIEGMVGSSETIYVPGGNSAVPKTSVESTFKNAQVTRLAGTTGYDTSNQIATWMVKNNKLSASNVCIANGEYPPKGTDALAGAALAGVKGGVVLLANPVASYGKIDTTTIEGLDSEKTNAFLTTNAKSVERAYLLGGTQVMTDEFKKTIEGVLE